MISCLKKLLILQIFIQISSAVFSTCIQNSNTWCGCGFGRQALGPCVGGECPAGYMCVCDYCCEGCRDDCYDCALYSQYCTNTIYCELRQKCQRTCEVCMDEEDEEP